MLGSAAAVRIVGNTGPKTAKIKPVNGIIWFCQVKSTFLPECGGLENCRMMDQLPITYGLKHN